MTIIETLQSIVWYRSKMVRHLLEKWKADPTKPDEMGMNALQTATFWANDNMKIIDLLLQHEKIDMNERDEIFGRTALHWAVRECNSIAVKYLIDKGADPNIYDKDGQYLHLAAYHETDLLFPLRHNSHIEGWEGGIYKNKILIST